MASSSEQAGAGELQKPKRACLCMYSIIAAVELLSALLSVGFKKKEQKKKEASIADRDL